MAGNKEKERLNKELHLRQIAIAKASRRGAPNLERPEPSKPEKPVILIVCEGKNTEPGYFKQFRLSSNLFIIKQPTKFIAFNGYFAQL